MSSVASHVPPSADLGIDDLPKDWRIAPLGEFLTASQYGLSVKGGPEGRCPILRMTNQVNGRIKAEKLQLPKELGDYVIVHELLHFSVPNHGRLWKGLMRAHLGDWERLAERLPKIARNR